jgi:hypothetical protein
MLPKPVEEMELTSLLLLIAFSVSLLVFLHTSMSPTFSIIGQPGRYFSFVSLNK